MRPAPSAALRRSPIALAAVALVLPLLGVAATVTAPADGPLRGAAGADHARTVRSDDDGVRARRAALRLSGPTEVSGGSQLRLAGMTVVRSRHGVRKARPVVVAERTARGWRTVARKRTSRTGTFAVRIPAGNRTRTRYFQARTTPVHGLPGVRTGVLRVKVVRKPPVKPGPQIPGTTTYDAAEGLPAGFVGLGAANDWKYLFTDGSRWNPCTVIRWAYNPAGQRYAALADVQRAFARIAGVSGLHFKYVGTTSYVYRGGALTDFPAATAEMTVGWANATQFPSLAGSVVGVGGGTAVRVSDQDVAYRMVKGYLTLDNDPTSSLPAGFDGFGWGQIMEHEVLHALGLGHAAADTQLMYGMASPKNFLFGQGDIAGMTKVGAASGCLA